MHVCGSGATVTRRDKEQKEPFGLFACGFSPSMKRSLFVADEPGIKESDAGTSVLAGSAALSGVRFPWVTASRNKSVLFFSTSSTSCFLRACAEDATCSRGVV